MVDQSNTKVSEKESEKKLVKATELPLHGNPYPSKDVVEEERPGMIELKVRSIRTSMEPYMSPVSSAFSKTKDFLSVGISHSQSTIQSLSQNDNDLVKGLLIGSGAVVGGLLGGRRFFRRIFLGSIFMAGAAAACYPKKAEEGANLAGYIFMNKIPELGKQQYAKYLGQPKEEAKTEPKSTE